MGVPNVGGINSKPLQKFRFPAIIFPEVRTGGKNLPNCPEEKYAGIG